MSKQTLIQKAKAYIELCYLELNKEDLLEARLVMVQNSIEKTGTYELLDF